MMPIELKKLHETRIISSRSLSVVGVISLGGADHFARLMVTALFGNKMQTTNGLVIAIDDDSLGKISDSLKSFGIGLKDQIDEFMVPDFQRYNYQILGDLKVGLHASDEDIVADDSQFRTVAFDPSKVLANPISMKEGLADELVSRIEASCEGSLFGTNIHDRLTTIDFGKGIVRVRRTQAEIIACLAEEALGGARPDRTLIYRASPGEMRSLDSRFFTIAKTLGVELLMRLEDLMKYETVFAEVVCVGEGRCELESLIMRDNQAESLFLRIPKEDAMKRYFTS